MDCALQLPIAAYHAETGSTVGIPGAGVLCQEGGWVLGAGQYRNSIARQSGYALLGTQPWRLGSVRLGAYAGVVSGYRRTPNAMGGVVASMPVPWGDLHLSFMPMVSNLAPSTFALTTTVHW